MSYHHSKQEWRNNDHDEEYYGTQSSSPSLSRGVASPFQDNLGSSFSPIAPVSPSQSSRSPQQHHSPGFDQDEDEQYPVGRPLSYFPTHHQPLSQQEYDDDQNQRNSQYHQMSPMEHAHSQLSNRSPAWGGGGYSGYQPDIPLVGIDIISSNLDAVRNGNKFSDTKDGENDYNNQNQGRTDSVYTTGAGVGQSQQPFNQYDNKHAYNNDNYNNNQSPADPNNNYSQQEQQQQPPPPPSSDNAVYGQDGQPIPKALLDPKVQRQLRKRKEWKPWFIWFVTTIQVAVLIFEFVKGYQRTGEIIETHPFNPMIGPGSGLRTGADLERDMGWWRIGIIYMCSGIVGFIFGGNFAPLLSPSMGASGAIFGLIGCLLLDLIQNWKLVIRPCWELSKLSFMIIFSFAFGLLPFLDNFAHIGGFFTGILSGLVFMPVVYFSKRDKYIKWGLRVIAFPCIILIIVVMLKNFYSGENHCSWCKYLSCLPINGWCDAFNNPGANTTTTAG
ncbi:hypothetical protein BGZ46_003979 [Entomortierella lignicola]|nr:hypothetical protein BGZ46_003979 [Entomortierella lignicola]